jgi:hypothetical protein
MLNYQLARGLSKEEADILSMLTGSLERFKLPNVFKTLRVQIYCDCGSTSFQFVKLAKWSDGMWLKEKDDKEFTDEEIKNAETFCTTSRFCIACADKIQSIPAIAAEYYQRLITSQYHYLMSMTKGKNVSTDFVHETIKTAAQRAALCYHEPENWRKYLPNKLRGRIK